jgi:hypothetical protein
MDDPLEENEPREPTDAERREQAAIIRQETDKMHDELMKREPMRFVLLQLVWAANWDGALAHMQYVSRGVQARQSLCNHAGVTAATKAEELGAPEEVTFLYICSYY